MLTHQERLFVNKNNGLSLECVDLTRFVHSVGFVALVVTFIRQKDKETTLIDLVLWHNNLDSETHPKIIVCF